MELFAEQPFLLTGCVEICRDAALSGDVMQKTKKLCSKILYAVLEGGGSVPPYIKLIGGGRLQALAKMCREECSK